MTRLPSAQRPVQITSDFAINLPPDAAYELLLDRDRVAPCMPGAKLGPELEDGSRAVTVKVKLGPMRFTYEGSVRGRWIARLFRRGDSVA